MNDDRLWAAIDSQRLRTADLLDDLTEDEWDVQSLCEDWTVRDVAAHLTMQQMSFRTMLGVALRNPGGLNTLIRKAAKSTSRRLPKENLAPALRAMVGSRRHNFGVTQNEALLDILVHGQDIAIPLGRELEMPTEPTAWVAERVWAMRGRGLARVFRNLPLRDLRLTATDVDWTVGEGPEVRGPVSALLLLLTGRQVALDRLEGEGVGILRERI